MLIDLIGGTCGVSTGNDALYRNARCSLRLLQYIESLTELVSHLYVELTSTKARGVPKSFASHAQASDVAPEASKGGFPAGLWLLLCQNVRSSLQRLYNNTNPALKNAN
jgi:hypothetical protein